MCKKLNQSNYISSLLLYILLPVLTMRPLIALILSTSVTHFVSTKMVIGKRRESGFSNRRPSDHISSRPTRPGCLSGLEDHRVRRKVRVALTTPVPGRSNSVRYDAPSAPTIVAVSHNFSANIRMRAWSAPERPSHYVSVQLLGTAGLWSLQS